MRSTLFLTFILGGGISLAQTRGHGEVPVFFVANRGQAPSSVRFVASGSGLVAHLMPGEIELRASGDKVVMRFEGANPMHQIEGRRLLRGRANFLTGGESNWRVNVPLYKSVIYRQLYPGIDMEYGGARRNLKSEFVVAPGADPSQIRVRYVGAGSPSVDADGSLVVSLAGRDLRERMPVVYQEFAGVKTVVAGWFLVRADGSVGFGLGEYDHTLPLVIDPVLSYSTLLGGSGTDTATALAVDTNGSAYIAGFTDSLDFPAINPVRGFNGGGTDVFVAKLSPDGTTLVYCTYLGGSADDRASAIAVDVQGNAYIAGSTTSRDFPLRSALQAALAGYRNAFVAKLSPSGNSLVYSTYLGGNSSDTANGIAVDPSGAAYVVGDTTSFSFPANGFQRGTHGGQDAFVVKLSWDGARSLYGTYLGGSNQDHGAAIAVDSNGTAYVTGVTSSTDFPVLNAAQRYNAGGQDAFVTRLSPDGNYLLFSTYLGGSGGTVTYPEIGQAIALDTNGNAYVTGVTGSSDFPLAAALQTVRKGALDAFVTKLNPSGSTIYSTYLGGSSIDVGNAITVDARGAAYIVGYTISTDLPVTNALQSNNAGDYDCFLARLSPAGDVVQYLSYLGGNASDSITAVALGPAATVYLAGFTLSTNFPLRSPIQLINGGSYGAFVTKVDFGGLTSVAVLNVAATHVGSFVQGAAGATYTVIVSNRSGSPPTTEVVTVIENVPSGLTLVAMSGMGWNCSSNSCTRADALAGGGSYPPITVTVNVAASAGTPLSNSVSVSGGGSLPANTSDVTSILASSAVAAGSGVFRAGLWVLDRNGDCQWSLPPDSVISLGQANDVQVVGDWNGDGRTKSGIFRQGLWILDYNGNGQWDGPPADQVFYLGQAGDIPVVGDWNGDGRTKVGIFRNGKWILDYNGNGLWDGPGVDRVFDLGQAGDVPLVGDWNGTHFAKAGIFRAGLWVLDYNGNGQWDGPPGDRFFFLGQAGDVPMIGDWNGDGRTKAAVFRQGLWVLDYDGNGQWDGPPADRFFNLGQAGDTPVVGDWNGDGRSKAGIFRAGFWVIDKNGNGQWDGPPADAYFYLGQAGDVPIVGKWQ